jgi:hypothetical protein
MAACGAVHQPAHQIEAFDSAVGWTRSGNASSVIAADPDDKREGAASLVWSSTIDEQITKRFDTPRDLSHAAELRIWIQGNQTVGSSCCSFSMRLLSSSGYLERHILPDIPPNVWTEDVSERDAWFPQGGTPSWKDIRGLEFVFFGDASTTVIHLDDLRAEATSSTTPTARQSAGVVGQEAGGPLANAIAWSHPEAATGPDGVAASVFIDDTGRPGFSASTYLVATNFGFSVPRDATIRGIRVEIRMREDHFLIWDWEVRLIRAGVRQGTDRSLDDDLPDEYAYRYFGGPDDTWDVSLTPEDVNSLDFGIALAVGTHSPPVTADVDDIRIGVYYDRPTQ